MSKWVLSVVTSLPEVCESKDDLKTSFYVFDDFNEARKAMRDKIRSFAFGENAMFDGKGNILMMLDFSEFLYEDYPAQILTDCFRKAFEGKNVSIEGIPDDEDEQSWAFIIKRRGDTVLIEGAGEGPENGYDPFIKTNIFDMSEEKHYYLYVNDMFDCDYSSELYMDLKRAEE